MRADLNERERLVLEQLRDERSVRASARELGVSKTRVEQLRQAVTAKVRTAFRRERAA
jgi:DNA-directed RNA polymerase specialized sigma subunit